MYVQLYKMGFFHIWLWLCIMFLAFVHNVTYIASLLPFIAKHYIIVKYTTFQCIDQLRGVFCFFVLSKLQLSWIKCQWMFECKSLCVHMIWFILDKPRNSLLQLYGRSMFTFIRYQQFSGVVLVDFFNSNVQEF